MKGGRWKVEDGRWKVEGGVIVRKALFTRNKYNELLENLLHKGKRKQDEWAEQSDSNQELVLENVDIYFMINFYFFRFFFHPLVRVELSCVIKEGVSCWHQICLAAGDPSSARGPPVRAPLVWCRVWAMVKPARGECMPDNHHDGPDAVGWWRLHLFTSMLPWSSRDIKISRARKGGREDLRRGWKVTRPFCDLSQAKVMG